MTMQRLILALSLGASLAAAQAPDSGAVQPDTAPAAAAPATPAPKPERAMSGEANLGEAHALIESGNSLVKTGMIVAVGGMLVGGAASGSAGPVIALAGGIAQIVGVPMTGVGAGRVNHGAEMLDPTYQPNYRGWEWYWVSLGLDAGATFFLIRTLNAYRDAETEDEEEEALVQNLPLVIVFAIGARVCYITSMVKFVKLASEGRRAAEKSTSSLHLVPDLRLSRSGHVTPGLQLAYRF